jgi:hypothetical protein
MFVFLAKMAETYSFPFTMGGAMTIVQDHWTAKDIKNYGAAKDSHTQIIPSNNNKLSEGRVWQLAQPGFLRYTPERASLTAH